MPEPLRLIRIMPVLLLLVTSCGEADAPRNRENDAQSALSDTPAGITPAALQAAAGEMIVRDFYTKNGWQPIWSPRAMYALTIALEKRAHHGLDHVPFLPDLAQLPAAAREIALTRAALTFAGALTRGVADPAKLPGIYTIPRPEVDLALGVVTAVRTARVGAWLDSLAPDTAEYATLANTYLAQRHAAAQENGPAIADGELIRPDD